MVYGGFAHMESRANFRHISAVEMLADFLSQLRLTQPVDAKL